MRIVFEARTHQLLESSSIGSDQEKRAHGVSVATTRPVATTSAPPATRGPHAQPYTMPDMKMIGAAIGAVLLIFAITINSTTSNIITEAGSTTQESGIWLQRVTDGPGKKDDPSPSYCDQDDGCDTDCCKALASKCKTSKAFAVMSAFAAAASLGGFVVPMAGVGAAAFNALCNLILFSITASLLNEKFSQDADCGVKVDGRDVSGGAAFGLAIVSFILALVQAGVFFRGKDEAAA